MSSHIALVTIFPTSQEFCNSDSVWESYANFSEDAQNFLLHKISHFSNSCEISERIDDEQMKCLIFYLYRLWWKVITLGRHAIQNYK